jgi:PhnB protein
LKTKKAAKTSSAKLTKATSKVKSSKRKTVKYIPKGCSSVTPYLIVHHAADALKFYKKALGAKEVSRFADSKSKKVMHAEIRMGDSLVMLADEFPEMNCLSPRSIGNTPIFISLYVEKVDKMVKKAVALGATLLRPVQDQFYGDRSGTIRDPFGHIWTISTHMENLTEKVIHMRFEAMKGK